jgi:hypothetical protein
MTVSNVSREDDLKARSHGGGAPKEGLGIGRQN